MSVFVSIALVQLFFSSSFSNAMLMFLYSNVPVLIPETGLHLIDKPLHTSPLKPTILFSVAKEKPSPLLSMRLFDKGLTIKFIFPLFILLTVLIVPIASPILLGVSIADHLPLLPSMKSSV